MTAAPSIARSAGTTRAGLGRTVVLEWLARWAPPGALALLVTIAYVPYIGEYLQGNDTWAHIWTSLDVPRVLTQPIMAGTSFPATWALFYRPVSSLSYALNYAVSGLNPTAFHLTDLLIHLLATFGLYGLGVVVFGLRPWAAAVGAATFALHPIMASVVPDVPRRHDPLALACLLGALLLVAHPRSGGRWWLAGSLVLLGLAELAKEIAYVGVVLVAPTMVVATWSRGFPRRQDWRRILSTLAGWAGVSVALLAWRFHVLGEIGGYHMHMAPLFDLDVALNDILRNLLWPFRSLLQTTLKAWFTEIGLAVLVTGLPMLLARRAASATLAYGWLWLVAFGVFQGLSHSQAPWHTYFTAAGLGFLAAGVFDGAAAACRGRFAAWLRLPLLKVAARAVLAACVAGVVVFQAGLLRESVVFTRYTAWHVTGELGRMYLADVQPCLAATPAGEPVVLDNFPYGLDDSTDQYVLVQAGVFANYALGPALALADGRPDLQVLEATGQGATLGGLPAALHTTCTTRDGAWWLQTTYDR